MNLVLLESDWQEAKSSEQILLSTFPGRVVVTVFQSVAEYLLADFLPEKYTLVTESSLVLQKYRNEEQFKTDYMDLVQKFPWIEKEEWDCCKAGERLIRYLRRGIQTQTLPVIIYSHIDYTWTPRDILDDPKVRFVSKKDDLKSEVGKLKKALISLES